MGKTTLYDFYAKRTNLTLDYQVSRAFLGLGNASLSDVCQAILTREHPRYAKEISKAFSQRKVGGFFGGSKTIKVPSIGIETSSGEVLAKFVKKNFDRIRGNADGEEYPFELRQIKERYKEMTLKM